MAIGNQESGQIRCLQAPTSTCARECYVERPITYAHILHNVGFDDVERLSSVVQAWRNLFMLVSPDLLILEHSPTALLAARTYPTKRVLVGSGFFAPPNVSPLPVIRSWVKYTPEALRAQEQTVLDAMNSVLSRYQAEPLDQIGRLFGAVDENFLTTFEELDHYPQRKDGRYWGTWTTVPGAPPEWPSITGKKVFAYLKSFPGLPDLLQQLQQRAHPTIIHADGIPAALRQRFRSSPSLRFSDRPLDIARVAEQCDFAILNGNHATTIALLLRGKPALQIPIYLEQVVFTNRVIANNCGFGATSDRPEEYADALDTLLNSAKLYDGATSFATNYASFDEQRQVDGMVDRMEDILAG